MSGAIPGGDSVPSAPAADPTLAELTSWDSQITLLNAIEGLSPDERAMCANALRALQAELGSDFLTKALRNGHDLLWTLANQVPWTRLWLAWLATAIQELRNAPQLRSVTRWLADPERCGEAVSVIRAGWQFARAGYSVAFDPVLSVRGSPKKPDLLISDPESGQDIVVEVTRKLQSYTGVNAWRTQERLSWEVMRHPVETMFAGRVFKSLSERHLEDVAKTLNTFTTAFRPESGFEKLEIPGVLSIGLATASEMEQLKTWAATIDVAPGQFAGPGDDTNELHLLAQKIRREQGHLPPDKPGLIIIGTSTLPTQPEHVAALANVLEESVHDYQQLVGVVLHGSYMGSFENIVQELPPHYFLQYEEVPLNVSQQLFVANKYCAHPLSGVAARCLRAALATRCLPDPATLATPGSQPSGETGTLY
jgi:hypothetical protein